MTFALGDLFPCSSGLQRGPFGDDAEVGLNLKQLLKDKRLGFANCFLHRQDPDEVIPDAQMVSFGIDIGIYNLIVEKLAAEWSPFNAPGVVIHQSAEETETVVPLQSLDWQEIGELPDKAIYALFELQQVCFNLLTKQDLHFVV